jgi:hypothetical protein
MSAKDDEEQERRRQEQERARLTHRDRIYGAPPVITASGFEDGRSLNRTGNVVPFPVRLQLRSRAIVAALMKRDNVGKQTLMFEMMLEAYQQVHGAIDTSAIPSDEELIRNLEVERDKRLENERDKRHGK